MKQTIIVTGGANGLGLALIRQSVKYGFYAYSVDLDEANSLRLKEELGESGQVIVGNIADEKFVNMAVKQISRNGQIAALINCGGAPSFKAPTEYTATDVDLCLEGLKGMIFFSTHVLKIISDIGGKIINIISSAALRGNANESVYCAAKWGEKGYTESLRAAYNATKVNVYGVYPGGINTNFYKQSRHYVSEEKQNSFMSANEIAEVIFENIFTNRSLLVEDIIINRLKG